jgi:hypothetical protein
VLKCAENYFITIGKNAKSSDVFDFQFVAQHSFQRVASGMLQTCNLPTSAAVQF